MVYNWKKYVRNLLFPTHCNLCYAPTDSRFVVCRDCYQELPWLAPGCISCAAPLPTVDGLKYCVSCQHSMPYLDACNALFHYRAPVDDWIRQLKFHQQLNLAKLLGQLMAAYLPKGKNVRLIPVPLHRRRLRQRGFNQALEIARPLQKRGYCIDARSCTRNRYTPQQSGLPATERLHNLRDAFSVRGHIEGEHIVLIDDVMTTGATLNALARTLKHAGAARVGAWVVARTPEPGAR